MTNVTVASNAHISNFRLAPIAAHQNLNITQVLCTAITTELEKIFYIL